jgi:diaminohydroxyphosphoribosylaminopyrimidine deaminase/5-amino-6-(5-phosphoribosylamino)uracil reductase
VVSGGLPGVTLLCTTAQAPEAHLAELQSHGVETLVMPEREGRVDVDAVLLALGERGVTSVLAECGGTLAASLLTDGAVDKVLAFIAPKLIGGATAPTPVEGVGRDPMEDALTLERTSWRVVGDDMLMTGYLAGARAQNAHYPAAVDAARDGQRAESRASSNIRIPGGSLAAPLHGIAESVAS